MAVKNAKGKDSRAKFSRHLETYGSANLAAAAGQGAPYRKPGAACQPAALKIIKLRFDGAIHEKA